MLLVAAPCHLWCFWPIAATVGNFALGNEKYADVWIGSQITSGFLGGPSPSWPDQEPIDSETIFTLASCTKLPTTVAVLHIVEKKLIALDDDVSNMLPALGRQKVLAGWDLDGTPILHNRQYPITLRHLLTHSSGAGYSPYNSNLARYQRYRGIQPSQGSTIEERFDFPLLFEPGQGWEYGCGIDWAGKLVEQLSGISLESYLQDFVWKPLGASSFTFWPDAQRHTHRHAALTRRNRATGNLELVTDGYDLNRGVSDCFGGHSGYCNGPDYTRLLLSILMNDGRVLRPETVDMMFQGQLSVESQQALQEGMETRKLITGDFYPGEVYNFALGGMLIEDARAADAPYSRGRRTLVWCGGTNQFWVSDCQ
ncbi:hypothetical protein ACKLNR_014627 [Fusarium oxysporum f. sp. zingiberi]